MQHLGVGDVKKEVLNDKLWRKVVSGEKVMVAQLWLFKDCVVPLHHHESEQISVVLQGALKFELEGREVMVRAGEVLVIPSNVPHSALAIEDTVGIDVFSPIRHDWLDGTDTICGSSLPRPAIALLHSNREFTRDGGVPTSSTPVME